MVVASLLVAAFVILLPGHAYAFGPIAHVDMGVELIGQAAALGAIGTIMRRFRRDFLRGTIAADREMARSLAPWDRHSHNWDRAFAMYRAAPGDPERAFFLGYVCHLAADAVAHNYFVPAKLAQSFEKRLAAHVYWEMRFDARVREHCGVGALRALKDNAADHRRFLRSVVPGNLIGPRLNVGLTGIAMGVQRGRAFGAASAFADRRSRLELSDAEADEVRRLAVKAQMSVLSMLDHAPIVGVDPRGLSSIRLGRRVRRELKAIAVHGGPLDSETTRLLDGTLASFRALVESSG